MPWYKAGTVSVTQNSNAVIGTGTAFIANSRVGDGFRGPDGGWYEVTNIASDTAMSISPNYQGATTSAGSYALAPLQGYVKDSADALRTLVNTYGAKLAALGTTGNYDTLPVTKGGTGGATQVLAQAGLGLPKTTSRLSVTAGEVVKVADYGRNGGANIVQVSTVDANTLTVPASYVFNGGGVNVPESAYLDHAAHAAVGYSKQFATGLLTDNTYTRVQNNGTFGAWKQFVLTPPGSPVSVAQGGTGGATQTAARSGLGLGTAATATLTTTQADLTVGRALKVADFGIGTQNTPTISSIDERQSGFFCMATGQTAGIANTPLSYGTLINCGFPGGTLGSQIFMGISPTGYIGFRSGDFATAAFNKIYHTGNTTRAADGTLKAI